MPKRYSVIAAAALFLAVAGNAFAHSDRDELLFVASDGNDAGRCQNAEAPCQTLNYAMRWVGKGGQIRVAGGSYAVANTEDLFHLISGNIDVRGGYKTANRFATPSSVATTLIGVPVKYAETLSQRGFHVVVDRKGIDREMAAETDQLLAIHDSLKSSMPATPCAGGMANGLPCSNVDLLSHIPLSFGGGPNSAADVWGFVDLNTNREYAIVGYRHGTMVYDVTDAENPRGVGFVDGQSASWRDIKVYQFWNTSSARWNAHAYITTDGSSDGLFVVDLSELPHRVERLNYSSDFSAAHNVYATNTDFGTGLSLTGAPPTLVIAGSNRNSGPYRAYSMADPESPVFAAMPGSGRSDYMHDAASMIITDSRKDTQCVNATTYCEILFDFNEGSFDIWDITESSNAIRLSRTGYANAGYVHSGWWSEDKQHLYVHDELDERDFGLNTTLRVFSIADLTAPAPAGQWIGATRAIDHNGFVRGNRYYMSNYSRGLTILDISNPANPVSVGRLDTYPASDGNAFVGAWGTYPFFHSGNVAISDIDSGFYMAADRTLDVPQGSLALTSRSYGGEEGTALQISVSRTGGSSGAVSVGYEIVPATASGDDLIAGNGVLNWSDADTADKMITLDLVADAMTEDLERMLIKLVAPSGGATLAAANVASVYVGEPGTASVVEFDQAIIDIAERGFATAVAVIERSGSAVGAISVDYSLSGGDADAGVDFQGVSSGTLTWADGDADPKSIEFAIIDDGAGEATEFAEFSLGNIVGATVGSQGTLRINIADGTGARNAPNAVAGASQIVRSGAMVTLNGSQSNDADGDALSYQWTQVAGNAVVLSNADTAVATFAAPSVSSDALLRFNLTVSDGTGLAGTATTSVTVRKVGGGGGGGSFGLLMLAALIGAGFMPRSRLRDGLTRTDAA